MRAHGEFRGREGSMPAGVDRPCAQHSRGRVVAEPHGACRGTGEVRRNGCGEGDLMAAGGRIGCRGQRGFCICLVHDLRQARDVLPTRLPFPA